MEQIIVSEKSIPTAFFSAGASPAPLYCATSTVPPIATPVHNAVRIKLIIEALLIAASPALPTNCPTAIISTMP